MACSSPIFRLSSSLLVAIRSAWNVRVAGWIPPLEDLATPVTTEARWAALSKADTERERGLWNGREAPLRSCAEAVSTPSQNIR